MKGGEADAARLLSLAQREIAEAILPGLSDDARYRMRLVLNALKIAAAELRDDGDCQGTMLAALAALEAAPVDGGAATLETLTEGLQALLRQGALDGDEALHRALVIIAEARCRLTR